MSIGLKGNVDGSGAVQVGGTDAITIATDTTVTMNGGVQRPLLSATAVASTSGTAIDFTNIPSWVKRVTVMFNGVSTNSTNTLQVQIGSGSVTTAGYTSSASQITGTNTTTISSITTGFGVMPVVAAADSYTGTVVLTLITGNTWVESGIIIRTSGNGVSGVSAGSLALGGALDRIRIIASATGSASDTFDAGSINILYE